MPPRITEKSCRPRVSNRTMVGNSATRLACEFQKTEWRRHDSDMNPQRGRSIDGPSLRGLWGRSATGQNGQAAANKEVSAVWSEGWMSENISGVPAGRSVFHLTFPFIGLTENCGEIAIYHTSGATVKIAGMKWVPLYALTALVTGLQNFYGLMSMVNGAPISLLNCISLLGSGTLLGD